MICTLTIEYRLSTVQAYHQIARYIMIDYERMACEIARLEYWHLSSETEECKDFWLAKYHGAARIIEIVTGHYPCVLNDEGNTFIVYIGEYRAVIDF